MKVMQPSGYFVMLKEKTIDNNLFIIRMYMSERENRDPDAPPTGPTSPPDIFFLGR